MERELAALQVEWPATPDVASRLELAPRRSRRWVAVAAIAIAVAIGAAFAVPQSRSAILRFLHLRGVSVEQVETLPLAEQRPLAAALGPVVGDAEAQRVLGAPFLPRRHGTLYDRGGFVSTLLSGPVLLTEFGAPEMLKKFAEARVEWIEVAPGVQGIWLAGPRHVVLFPGLPPRYAGNVLVWADDRVTYRLEGHSLDRDSAVLLAREIIGTSAP
jgi:hypothetical protein